MDIAQSGINPAIRNEDALRFLLTRRSRPAKTLVGPAPDRATLTELLTAAVRVPDHGKLEPWRLVVIQGGALQRLAQAAESYAADAGIDPNTAAKGSSQFAQSPLCVAVIGVPRSTDKVPELEQTLSVGCVCMGLVNAALAAGWGACWLTTWAAHDGAFTHRALDLADGEWVAGYIHIGTQGTQPPERPRPDVNAVTTWIE